MLLLLLLPLLLLALLLGIEDDETAAGADVEDDPSVLPLVSRTGRPRYATGLLLSTSEYGGGASLASLTASLPASSGLPILSDEFDRDLLPQLIYELDRKEILEIIEVLDGITRNRRCRDATLISGSPVVF